MCALFRVPHINQHQLGKHAPIIHVLGIRMCIMCLTPSTCVESLIRRNGDGRSRVETTLCCTSAYPVQRSASKVNPSGADVQVVPCHGYLVFHPCVEQLTVFYVSGLVLASSSILRVLNLDATSTPSQWHREQHVPNRYVNCA